MQNLLAQYQSDKIFHESGNIAACIGDITIFSGDAIVNAANASLLGGGGVDGAIHWKAGYELYAECKTLGGCKTGDAKITKGYNLPAQHVIHTVGPIYDVDNVEAHERQEKELESCYIRSMDVAKENNLHSIAFPCIATGVYSYPRDKAANIAVASIKQWLREHPEYEIKVVFVCFEQRDFEFYEQLLK